MMTLLKRPPLPDNTAKNGCATPSVNSLQSCCVSLFQQRQSACFPRGANTRVCRVRTPANACDFDARVIPPATH